MEEPTLAFEMRPSVFSDEELREVARLRRGLSRRGAQEMLYALRAMRVLAVALRDDEHISEDQGGALLWLGDPDAPQTWRLSHLAALGRVPDPAELIGCALALAELRPTAADARVMVRRMRGVAETGASGPRPRGPSPWERTS
jgi:hypothetical protein